MKHVHGLCLIFGWCIYPTVYICAASQERSHRNDRDTLTRNSSLSHESGSSLRDYKYFLRQIFEKYGHDGVITLEGFEHLLENLGIGELHFHDHNLSSHRKDDSNRTFTDFHEGSHNHTVYEGKLPNVLQASENRTAKFHDYHVEHADHHKALEKNRQNEKMGSSRTQSQNGVPWTTDASLVNSKEKCLSSSEILRTTNINPDQQTSISENVFLNLCPIIVYELDQRLCDSSIARHRHHEHTLSNENRTVNSITRGPSHYAWFYSTLAVLIISVAGMLSVAIVPVMQKFFYHQLLQFLVSLAIGSLTGDALLHLLPHAMKAASSEHEPHFHELDKEHSQPHSHEEIWLGLMAVGGIILFFCAERLLNALNSWKRSHSAKSQSHQMELSLKVGEKLSKHRYGSYGYSYSDAPNEMLQGFTTEDGCDEKDHHNCFEKSSENDAEFNASATTAKKLLDSSGLQIPLKNEHQNGKRAKPVSLDCQKENVSFNNDLENNCPESVTRPKCSTHTVNHHHHHHHHRHHLHRHHGHSHEIPQTASATAWMVIAGDGLHNFSDGMAIGAAFANSLTGGLSTSIAVFCHELPHELGDFALLIKAGMKLRQALFYNCLSSLLCLFGMLVGLAIGNIHSANSWVFAAAAGMFIYIALVDMMPELSCETEDSSLVNFFLQVSGISVGIVIMFLIAFYEDDLLNLIKD